MISLMNPNTREAPEYRGLSTDEKPMGVANGAALIEIDTFDVYFYDAENEKWIWFNPEGGSSEMTAEQITYNNLISGLVAETVQAAIDELAEKSGGGTFY